MNKVFLSAILGLPAPVVFILGAELFEVHGKNSFAENLAGCLAVALYLAFCQFWVAPKGRQEFRAKWPTLSAMIAPLLLAVVYIACKQKISFVWAQGILVLVSGCLGSLGGAYIAGRRDAPPLR